MALIVSPNVGSFDINSLPESKGQASKTAEMPAYVNTQQIDAQVLAALQAEAENVTKGMAAAAKESPQKDLFDMSESRLKVHFNADHVNSIIMFFGFQNNTVMTF